MARKVQNAYYANNEKTRIECEFVSPDGSLQHGVINKASGDGNIHQDNPDWAWVHDELGQESIDDKTLEYLDNIANQEAEETMKRERKDGEELFNMKLKIFEIDEIRDSKNSKMKAKIRRSDNMTKLNVYAAALVVMESSHVEPLAKKAPPEKKAGPKKKAAPKSKAPAKKTAAKIRLIGKGSVNAVEPVEATKAKKELPIIKGVLNVSTPKGMSNEPPVKPKNK